MKTKLGILIVLVFLWCLLGCGDIGGGRAVDPNNTHQIDTVTKPLPDSILVKDTSMALLSFHKYDTLPIQRRRKPRPNVVSTMFSSFPDPAKCKHRWGTIQPNWEGVGPYTVCFTCGALPIDSIRLRKTGEQ